MTSRYQSIARHIESVTGTPFSAAEEHDAGGGCINRAVVLRDGGQRYFVKLNRAELAAMFSAEAEGLAELRATQTIRAPAPICHGTDDAGQAYLVLEYIEFGGSDAQLQLGRQLAAMHRSRAAQFGWHRDNTIGSTPQINSRDDDWARFWSRRRLAVQLELAARNGHRGQLQSRGALLLEKVPLFFTDYRPVPSLLHGDLWGGNWSTDRNGNPVLYDPAVYYGDRETDLAMTELFGGFGPAFYRSYQEAWPLDPGYATRKHLYNLYHVLNHLNLFGGGYGAQAEQMIARLLAECG